MAKQDTFTAAHQTGSFLNVRWHLLLAFLVSSQICFANDNRPPCPAPGATRPPVVRYSGPATLEGDDRFLFRAWDIPEIVIEAGYDTSGALTCATPLSGPSYYWAYALKALQKRGAITAGPDGRVVVIFPDPDTAIIKDFHDHLIPRCGPNEPLEGLLLKGRRLLLESSAPLAEAEMCYLLALEQERQSVAAHYGIAVVYYRENQIESAISHYQKAVTLRPQFYENKIEIARLYGKAGHKDKEEALLKEILGERPPLPVQEQIYRYLVRFYDHLDRRKDALDSLVSSVVIGDDLRLRNAKPSSWTSFYNLSSERRDLGLRLEEQKRYQEADKSYRDALDFAQKAASKMSQADLFILQLGQARTLRQLGNTSSARSICSDWQNKLPRFGSELEDFHWQGEGLAQARWELSCGDFSHGLKMIEAVIRHDAKSPDNGDIYRPAAPYRALETIYRARGDARLARLARETADRIWSARSSQALAQIFEDAQPLFGTTREPESKNHN